ncbi:MAG: DegT/DnrJ/EryC1/StrS family aminotransferase [Nitrospirota bacterium]
MIDLKAEYQRMKPAIGAAVDRVLAEQHFILGPTVEACEQAVAKWILTRSLEPSGSPSGPPPLTGVGVASGTDALILALRALGIGPGDAVITTPYTFFATASSIALVGATPVFADVDPVTLTLDPERVDACIQRLRAAKQPRPRALLPVHLFGHCADMEPLLALARREGLAVVEDMAQAIGASYDGAMAGTMGAMGCLSFFPTKNLGGYGDGGMVLTTEPSLDARLRRLRNHGMVDRYHHEEIGLNSRLDALQAAVLTVKLNHLDEWTEARRAHARRYAELFSAHRLTDRITPPVERPNCRMVYHHYVVRAQRRDELAAFLRGQGVGCEIYYPVPLHRQPCFGGLPETACPVAERASAETLALPVFPLMTPDQQNYVVEQIARFYGAR